MRRALLRRLLTSSCALVPDQKCLTFFAFKIKKWLLFDLMTVRQPTKPEIEFDFGNRVLAQLLILNNFSTSRKEESYTSKQNFPLKVISKTNTSLGNVVLHNVAPVLQTGYFSFHSSGVLNSSKLNHIVLTLNIKHTAS